METQNSVSRKLEYHIKSIKNDILNRNVRLLKSMFISMYSILSSASFCMNYCINVAWHGGDQPVALLRCNGSPGCVDSGLQVICIVGSRLSMGFRSGEFAGQSSTVTPWSLNQLLVPLPVWAGAKSCWKNEISISIKLVSRRKHESALKCPGIWLHWLWTSENTVDQHQQMTRQPKSSLTEETSLWTSSNMDSAPLHSSSRLWDLDFQIKCKIYFHLKKGL